MLDQGNVVPIAASVARVVVAVARSALDRIGLETAACFCS